MSASHKVLLILGSGPNIGASLATLFAQNGYKVGLAARRLEDNLNKDGQLEIKADFSKAGSIESAFDKVTAKFGPPSAVAYNGASIHWSEAEDPLSLSTADLMDDFTLNTVSVHAAARRAVEGFGQLPDDVPKTFMYTGNALSSGLVITKMLSAGIYKSANAHMMAVASKAYAPKGYRFYYVDERWDGGGAAFKVSGPNNAQHMLELAETKEEKPWNQTFIGGKGYVDFSGQKW